MDLEEIKKRIYQVEGDPTTIEEFKAHGRYPYTYAWDFIRSHGNAFPEIKSSSEEYPNLPSRSDVGVYFLELYDGDYDIIEPIAEELAMAYYREWN